MKKHMAIAVAFLCFIGISSQMEGVANATAFTTDISITGKISFASSPPDLTSYAVADPGVSQAGSFFVKQGGATTTSTFTGTTPSGSNPLLATLTDFGDGFGNTVQSSTTTINSHFGIGDDITMVISNNSASDTYTVTFAVDFSNIVDSRGSDAYVRSEYTVENPTPAEVFFSDLTTDTLYGNKINSGTTNGVLGGQVSDIGASTFDVTLPPPVQRT